DGRQVVLNTRDREGVESVVGLEVPVVPVPRVKMLEAGDSAVDGEIDALVRQIEATHTRGRVAEEIKGEVFTRHLTEIIDAAHDFAKLMLGHAGEIVL